MFFKYIYLFLIILFFAFASCKIEYNLTDLLTSDLNKTINNTVVKRTWQVVGSTGFSSFVPYTLDIKVDNSGDPIVSYIRSLDQLVFLDEFTGSWNEYSYTMPNSINNQMAMALVANVPTIFGNTTVDGAGNVVYYNTGSWLPFPAIGYSSCPDGITIMDDNGKPLIGYFLLSDYKYYIRSYDGATWNTFSSFLISGDTINKSQLQKKAGIYYLSYRKTSVGSIFIKNNNVATSLSITPETLIDSSVNNFSMSAAGNGIAYVVFFHFGDNNVLHFYSFDGISLNPNVFPDLVLSQAANNPSLIVVDPTHVFIAVAEGSVFPKIKVFFFNGSNWLQCGSDVGNGITGVPPAIDLASDGTPYVAYSDNDFSGKITVKAFK